MNDPNFTSVARELASKIDDRSAVVGIIGLGYVGLPLALAFAESGFPVLGFDVDPSKVEKLGRGECYIEHLDTTRLERAVASGRLSSTIDFLRLGEPDAILICVPTPLDRHRAPDLSYVEATAAAIARCLRGGQLVVLESTTYPGTTDEVLQPLLEAGGLRSGSDFFLAFSPEREDPGNPDHSTTSVPKVIGADDETSRTLARSLYSHITPETVLVSSSRTAEATKLMENIFRAVNIALVNEMKMVCDRMDIDIWEVLDAAETKPFGFMRFNPGPGWGGHCIPIDPFYLSWKAREYEITPRFIELAGAVNREVVDWVVGKVQNALNGRGRSVSGSRILLLGVAYKPNVDDPRESPAFEILERLRKLGARLSYHDPHIASLPSMRSWPDLPDLESLELTETTLAEQDLVLVVTDHAKIDWELVQQHAPLVVDTRGVLRDPSPNLVRA